MNFRENFLQYILVPLFILMVGISYTRFILNRDYIVAYEGMCDPSLGRCFEGCSDDSCTQKTYYSRMVKYEPDLYNECGNDITGCEFANKCLPGDHDCSVTYCDPKIDGDVCETIVENQGTFNNIQSGNVGNLESTSTNKTNI